VGPLSLREAIEEANANPGDDTIDFSMIEQPDGSTTGPFVIKVGSTGLGPLPPITDAVTIDGYTAPGASMNTAPYVPLDTTVAPNGQFVSTIEDDASISVALDGSALKSLPLPADQSTFDGLFITPAATPLSGNPAASPNGTLIEGLSIHSFPTDGIGIRDSSGNTIAGNFLGIDPSGRFDSNTLAPFSEGNARSGIVVQDGSRNVIGGPTPGARNLVSGNGFDGVALSHEAIPAADGMNGNIIQNNYIGLQRDGITALRNGSDGIDVLGATGTLILGNAVSGNDSVGIALLTVKPAASSPAAFFTPDNNVIQGNTIGLDAGGLNFVVPQTTSGVQQNAENLDGNLAGGLFISGGSHNTIGLDVDFEPVVPTPQNPFPALQTALEDTNSISGNGDFGVRIESFSAGATAVLAAANVLRDDMIGTDRFGFAARGNNTDGIQVIAAPNTQIGGPSFEAGNLISGNNGSGIHLLGADTTGTLIIGDSIGTNTNFENGIRNGIFGLGNKQDGILIEGAPDTTIGGIDRTDPATGRHLSGRNVIAGNDGAGIHIEGDVEPFLKPFVPVGSGGLVPTFLGTQQPPDAITATGTLILGNDIGVGFNVTQGYNFSTDIPATITSGNTVSNQGDGVLIEGAVGTTVGSPLNKQGNIVANNGNAGVHITALTPLGLAVPPQLAAAMPTVIQANLIGLGVSYGTDPALPQFATIATQFVVPNKADGILIEGASSTTIGGTGSAQGNAIAGNGGSGIHVLGLFPGGNLSAAPIIPSGTMIAGNGIGVGSARFEAAAGNVLAQATLPLPSAGDGILLEGAAASTIGVPSTAGPSNIIAGNGGAGIHINGSTPEATSAGPSPQPAPITAVANTIQNNLIGLGLITGTGFPEFEFAVSNSGDGVLLNRALDTLIGGTAAGTANIISGNRGAGVHIIGMVLDAAGQEEPLGTLIQGNDIGTDRGGDGAIHVAVDPVSFLLDPTATVAPTSNASDGVLIDASYGNTVGGAAAADRNIITGNGGWGIRLIAGSSANTVAENFVGLGRSATTTAGGNRADGIAVVNSPANAIQANVISGNGNAGLSISGSSDGTAIVGNLIGTAPDGSPVAGGNPTGNIQSGILVNGTTHLTIGGTSPGARNIIAANKTAGITITNVDAPAPGSFAVIGNDIGTSLAGTLAADGTITTAPAATAIVDAGNQGDGIDINNAINVAIGGPAAGTGNVIAGNLGRGIHILGDGQTINANLVLANLVGVVPVPGSNPAMDVVRGNASDGIVLDDAVANQVVQNLISGNGGSGVEIVQGAGNTVTGNLVGTGPSGREAAAAQGTSFANKLDGVQLDATRFNTIGTAGTPSLPAGNTISNNGRDGLEIIGGSTGNLVLGNRIGTTGDGTGPLGNTRNGIFVDSSSSNAVGLDPAHGVVVGNIISGNGNDGLAIADGSTSNQVAGNLIGTASNGTVAIPNAVNGITVDRSDGNRIGVPGATIAAAGSGVAPPSNLISGNAAAGIEIDSATGNQVAGNFLGTTSSGEDALPNGVAGVFLNEAPANTIGGTSAADRNVIASRDSAAGSGGSIIVGVQVFGTDAGGNVIAGDFIGTDASGTRDFGNTVGIYINNVPDTRIGPGNVISGNDDADIQVFGNESRDTVIQSNIIGLNAAGTANLSGLVNPRSDPRAPNDPRTTVGVEIDQALHTKVAGNKISGNYVGIEINGNATIITAQYLTPALLADFGAMAPALGVGSVGSFSVIEGNTLGVLPASPLAAGQVPDRSQDALSGYVNNAVGVYILDSARNRIGVPGAGNMVLGDKQAGIELDGTESTLNLVQANTLIDNLNGVFIHNAQNNTIGGTAAGEGNTITDDHPATAAKIAQSGVYIFDLNSTGDVIVGNIIKGMKYYGVLFYNTPQNANANLEKGNQVSQSGTADFRIYNGVVARGTKHHAHKARVSRRHTRLAEVHPKGPRHGLNPRAVALIRRHESPHRL
jgi:parallel beta-helix repeat protein